MSAPGSAAADVGVGVGVGVGGGGAGAAKTTGAGGGGGGGGDTSGVLEDEASCGGCISYHLRTHVMDYFLAILLAVLAVIFSLIEPAKRVFDPNDPRILYPYFDNTIPTWSLPLMTVLLPIVCFILAHLIITHGMHDVASLNAHRVQGGRVFFGLLLANALTFATTNAIKIGVGRPRPNSMAMVGYVNGTFTFPDRVTEAFSSFPSGHSSIISAGMVFLFMFLVAVFYPNVENRPATGNVWRSLVCLLPWALLLYVSCTRVTDYWHNYDDVLAGNLLGSLIAVFVYRFHSAVLPRRKPLGFDQKDYKSVLVTEPGPHQV